MAGHWYEDGEYSYSSLDMRTTMPNGKTIGLDDWGATEVYASTVGCAGEENVWEDFDQVVDETEVVVTPSDAAPGAVQVDYIATWSNGGDSFQTKASAVVVPRDGFN